MLKNRISNIGRFLRQHKLVRRLLIIGISFLLALPATWILQYFVGLRVDSFTPNISTFTISNETIYSPPFDIYTNGPSYFESVGRVYAYQTSPYASAFQTFDVWMSLDNSSWTKIPLLSSQTSDRTQMAGLGLVELDNPRIVIYMKYYVPPQTFTYAVNATKAEIEDSFRGYIQIVKEATSRDTSLSIFAFFVFFAVILQISDILFLKEDKKTKEGNKAKKQNKAEKGKNHQTNRKSR